MTLYTVKFIIKVIVNKIYLLFTYLEFKIQQDFRNSFGVIDIKNF